MNDIHISAAFVTLARSTSRGGLRLRKDQRFLALLARAEAVASSLRAQSSANIMWALAKIRHAPEESFLACLADASVRDIQQFWPQNIANSLWACAKLRLRPRCSMVPTSVELGNTSETFRYSSDAVTASGIAKGSEHLRAGGSCEGDAASRLVQSLAEEACCKAAALSPVEFANSLWALSQFRCSWNAKFLQLIRTPGLETTFHALNERDIARCLSACSAFGLRVADGGIVSELEQLYEEK